MLIKCPFCNTKASIVNHSPQADNSTNISCLCRNDKCLAVFSYVLAFSHTLHGPKKTAFQVDRKTAKGSHSGTEIAEIAKIAVATTKSEKTERENSLPIGERLKLKPDNESCNVNRVL